MNAQVQYELDYRILIEIADAKRSARCQSRKLRKAINEQTRAINELIKLLSVCT
jgi:hypothetical protein